MRGVVLAAAAVLGFGLAAPAEAAEGEMPKHGWSFEGVFGTFDTEALQRGFQVYEEVCAGCHGVKYLNFRHLGDIGFGENEVKAIAAEYEVEDGPDEDGEMFTRAAIPSDPIPVPYPNDNAARASNNGALPPDLSLVAKARVGGPDYLYALLTGYEEEPPEGVEVTEGMNYNAYFPGNQIAMPPPLFEDGVEYTDGTAASVAQQAEDVSHFLMWAAEPKLEARKHMGVKVVLFLIVLTALFYASKRKVWASAGH